EDSGRSREYPTGPGACAPPAAKEYAAHRPAWRPATWPAAQPRLYQNSGEPLHRVRDTTRDPEECDRGPWFISSLNPMRQLGAPLGSTNLDWTRSCSYNQQ